VTKKGLLPVQAGPLVVGPRNAGHDSGVLVGLEDSGQTLSTVHVVEEEVFNPDQEVVFEPLPDIEVLVFDSRHEGQEPVTLAHRFPSIRCPRPQHPDC